MPLGTGSISKSDSVFDPNSGVNPSGILGTEQPISTPIVLTGVKSQTGLNQLRGSTVAGSTGIGIPKQVSNVTATLANASKGSTSKVTITFLRDPSDQSYSGVTVYVKGYQGNQTPTQIASGTDSPLNVIINNTGESISLIVRANGNGGSAPLSTAPTTGLTLPKNVSGGFGTSTSTNLTSTQVQKIAGGNTVGTGTLSLSSAIQSSPLTVNLSTEGTYDWMFIFFTGGSLAGNTPEATGTFKLHSKMLNGRLLNNFRFVPNAQLADGATFGTSNFTFNSNSGDDASLNETVNPAGTPLVNRQGGFFFNNNNSLFFYPFGFQWRDIPLPNFTPRTLKFYVVVNNATATMAARISDGSAADASVSVNPGGLITAEYVITLNVTPGSFGATLSVSWLTTSFVNGASGCGITAVTMA
jgi:hypothetical protein